MAADATIEEPPVSTATATTRHEAAVETDLTRLSGEALDELYRGAAPGAVPRGVGRGTAIVAPSRRAGRLLAAFVRLTAWKGKQFDDDGRQLVNLVSPFGIRAIRADVYMGDSWLDGRPAIFIDYSKTSWLARWVHDEVREIEPGRYLGLVYLRRRRLPVRFALRFSAH
jgi:hypothetical protein